MPSVFDSSFDCPESLPNLLHFSKYTALVVQCLLCTLCYVHFVMQGLLQFALAAGYATGPAVAGGFQEVRTSKRI